MSEPLTVERLQTILDRSPFIAFMNMRAKSVVPEREEVTIAMAMRPEFERGKGTRQYHGGVIATLIDVTGDFALALVVGGPVPTINFRVDFLRPASKTDLTATARVRRAGRTVGVVDIDVHDDNGKLIAVGRGCYSAIPG
jgi:uncharacterized protein (TIGR00369 family)